MTTLEKIREEIEFEVDHRTNMLCAEDVFKIIDKYAEQEPTDEWQELKETIIEMRDNDGTGTQQDACKFLANYMEVLEKQMREPKGGER